MYTITQIPFLCVLVWILSIRRSNRCSTVKWHNWKHIQCVVWWLIHTQFRLPDFCFIYVSVYEWQHRVGGLLAEELILIRFRRRAAILKESDSQRSYDSFRLLCTWYTVLEVMRKEERCCGHDTPRTKCDLYTLSLKFSFQVKCEGQITMWIYDHSSFCSRDPTFPEDLIKIFALSQPSILFSKDPLKRYLYHSCSPMSAKKKYKKFCWAATQCTELNKSFLPEELQRLYFWQKLAFFPSSLGFSIMTSVIAVDMQRLCGDFWDLRFSSCYIL